MDDLTRVRRLPHHQRTKRTELDSVLDAGRVAHVAIVQDMQPLAIPMAYVRDGDELLFHGSTGSRAMRELRSGAPMYATVTILDGIVVARCAFESSMHYRAAMLFGSCHEVNDVERASRLFTNGILPGRTEEVRPSSSKELAATLVVRLPIDRWSLKVSDGDPEDLSEDQASDAWAGVVPIRSTYGPPRPSADLKRGIEVPPSVRSLAQ